MKKTALPDSKKAEKWARALLEDILDWAWSFPELRKQVPSKSFWQVDVSFVGDTKMKRLNAEYRHKDQTTDILSFPAPDSFQFRGILGELILSRPQWLRQAREHHHSPKRELEVLLVHGVLHLLGMDHERGGAEEKRMRRWEDRLLGLLSGTAGLIGRSGSSKS